MQDNQKTAWESVTVYSWSFHWTENESFHTDIQVEKQKIFIHTMLI